MKAYIAVLFLFFTLNAKVFLQIADYTDEGYICHGLSKNITSHIPEVETTLSNKDNASEDYKNISSDLDKNDEFIIITVTKSGVKYTAIGSVRNRNGHESDFTGKLYGTEKNLHEFYRKILKKILAQTKSRAPLQILDSTNDNYVFLKIVQARYYSSIDENKKAIYYLESIADYVNKNDELREFYSSLGGDQENLVDHKLISLKNPKSSFSFNDFISNCYSIKIDEVKVDHCKDDSTLVNIHIAYNIFLKPLYKRILMQGLKESDGETKLNNYNIYTYSSDDDLSGRFIDIIKSQKIKVSLMYGDSVLTEQETFISMTTFDKGAYREGVPVFPIMPLGPADNKFKLTPKTTADIFIEEFSFESFEKVDNYIFNVVIEK
ncbi:MAG: hypothetical protein JXR48_15935 [Candidatus Delongbacteria bacterium]|nr:hypothetical protein [Candidatus Delongbacteria bacterium]MBN2836448.1 hypothetical protein [Candidatus Delongbacteria bacterium]